MPIYEDSNDEHKRDVYVAGFFSVQSRVNTPSVISIQRIEAHREDNESWCHGSLKHQVYHSTRVPRDLGEILLIGNPLFREAGKNQ